MSELGDVIQAEMAQANLEPVEFDRPLKSVSMLVRLRKEVEPESAHERHSIIGWGFSSLLDYFNKEMWSIKSFTLVHESDKITIEATVRLSGLTFAEDHEEWLGQVALGLKGIEFESGAYYACLRPRRWSWDSVEPIGPIRGFTQMRGDGTPTGTLDDKD